MNRSDALLMLDRNQDTARNYAALLAENERLREALDKALTFVLDSIKAGQKGAAGPAPYSLESDIRAALAGGSACQDCRETGFSACHHALAGGRGEK